MSKAARRAVVGGCIAQENHSNAMTIVCNQSVNIGKNVKLFSSRTALMAGGISDTYPDGPAFFALAPKGFG